MTIGLLQSNDRTKRSAKIETQHGGTMHIIDGMKLNSNKGFDVLTEKLYIRRNNNKLDFIEKGRIVIAHLLP